jgi:RecA/RadA recombinase
MAKKKKVETNATKMIDFIEEMSERAHVTKAKAWERVPTGSPTLDYSFGGGIPMGAVTEFFGPPNTAKSTLAVLLMVNIMWRAIEEKRYMAYFDLEGRHDVKYWAQLGAPFEENYDTGDWECTAVDSEGMPYVQIIEADGGSGEKYVQVTIDMIKSGLYYSIVIDAVANLTATAEMTSKVDGSHMAMGLQARLMTKFNRMVSPFLRGSRTIVIALNQARAVTDSTEKMFTKTGLMSPGGKSFHHQATLRLETYQMQDGWHDGKARTDLAKLVIRYYVRKTSASTLMKGLETIEVVRGEDGNYFIDVAEGLFRLMKKLGVCTNKSGKVWASGFCCFDAYNWGYNNNTMERQIGDEIRYGARHEYVDAEGEDFRIIIGKDTASIIETLNNDIPLLLAVEAATRAKYGAKYDMPDPIEVEDEPPPELDELQYVDPATKGEIKDEIISE